VYICGGGKYVELFKINNKEIMERKVISNTFPNYKVAKDNLNYGTSKDDNNHGFTSFVTDQYIYLKPVEFTFEMIRTGGKYKGYPCQYNDRVDVWDWDGNLVKRYEFDVPFHTFGVDEENNTIYVQTDDLENGNNIIRRYGCD
jgi:hypothetical protein